MKVPKCSSCDWMVVGKWDLDDNFRWICLNDDCELYSPVKAVWVEVEREGPKT